MSKGSAARRRRLDTGAGRAECRECTPETEALGEEVERLGCEGEVLRDQVAEVEGWYSLLRADRDRLEGENRKLSALVAGLKGAGSCRGGSEGTTMFRILSAVRAARRRRWAAAALVAIVTLLARDPSVKLAFEMAATKARQALNGGDATSPNPADSGYVRFATMLHARDQADRARDQYNRAEATLKGDALLEAQDRLRATKARYRQARLAFLPELARQCRLADITLPAEMADALDALKTEVRE